MDRFEHKLITIIGGSGFVGSQLVQLLARQGHRIRIGVRRPDLAGHLKPLGNVGQIQPIQVNIRNRESIERAVAGVDVVINLVGVGFESGRQSFRAVHVDGAKAVAEAAKAAGAELFLHMSALGVDAGAKVSAYAASKLGGEQAVRQAFPEAIIFRPSLMFGRDDGFFNLMGSLARLFPVMPLIGGKTRFQPVYVGDVADAFAAAVAGTVETGRIYELGGPEVETHKQLLQRILREAQRRRPLLPLPMGLAKLSALPFALLPFRPLITADQVELLHVDNVVSDGAIRDGRTLEGIGIGATSMETILPTYLWRFRRNGQFDENVSHGTTV